MEQERVYEFGRFLLDSNRQALVKDGEQVHLTPKAFDVLVVLLSAGGCVVSKDELMNKVWPDTCVEESNVSQSIWMLRTALEDKNEDGTRQYISTVWRRGYKIVVDVTRVDGLQVGILAGSERNGSESSELGRSNVAMLASSETEMKMLTPTERRVLEMIADNRMSRQIAGELGISVRTIENHRARIRAKLGISGSNSLLKFALEHKWEIRATAGEW